MPIQTLQVAVSIPVSRRLAVIKEIMTGELGRQVTYTEVLEMLLDEHAVKEKV